MRESTFEFSELPGNFATPLIGAAAAALVGVSGQLGVRGMSVAPFVVLAVGAIALFAAGMWLARNGVLRAPMMRARGVNLVATPPGTAPSIWLCAHLDSKSQPVPTLLRTTGILLEGVGYAIVLLTAAALAFGNRPNALVWAAGALMTLAGAVPVVLSVVGARSPGALDNASGVASILGAARILGNGAGVGVLLTDAEELGLAGARAWSLDTGRITVLNCDGVDDDGDIQVMYSGARPVALLAAVERAARSASRSANPVRLIPGVLTDSVAFADAGMASVTFSRGTWRSLARVHSPRDDLSRLRGTGIADVATLIAGTVRELGATR